MKKRHANFILLLLLAMAACTAQPAINGSEPDSTATATLPAPQVHVTPAPDVDSAVDGFMQAWQDEDFAGLYELLSSSARSRTSEEDFINQYRQTAAALTLRFEDGIVYKVISKTTNPNLAAAVVQVNYNTYLFGTLTRQINLDLVREAGTWRLEWDEGVLLPELEGGNVLEIVR